MAQRLSGDHLWSSISGRFGGAERRGTAWSSGVADAVRRTLLPEAGSGFQPQVASRPMVQDAAPRRWQGIAGRLVILVPRLVLGVATVMLLLALGLFLFRTVYGGRIYPAVVVGDVPVGGLSMAQAEDRLGQRADQLEQGIVTFTYGDQTWTPRLSELGATIYTDRSLVRAQALGREDDAVTRLAFAGSVLHDDQTVPLETSVDWQNLNAWFDRVDSDLAQPARNAALAVDGLTVSVTPDADGLVVDRETARAQVLDALTTLEPVTVELPTSVQEPRLRVADLNDAKRDVEAVLAEPVNVAFEGEAWTLQPEDLSPFLAVETGVANGAPDVKVTMNQEELAATLRDQFAERVNRKPVNAEVRWSPDNVLIATEPSTDGITLRATTFAGAVSESFLGDHGRVDIPVVVTNPEVDDDNLDALKIETKIGSGDSNYEGSSDPRAKNIAVGVDLLNGTLVKPGAEFSLNKAIGEITEDKGYVEASVVVAERAGKDIGGGICQVSTTVYRAALMSGMPITELNPHTYRLGYYEREGWGPGIDASILQLGPDPANWGDFKFKNDTDGWLLVESWASYPHVIVNIYGQDTGRKVELSETDISDPITNNPDIEDPREELPPGTIQLVETPLDGLETSFVRYIYDENGDLLDEKNFYTYFKGRGNVYAVSPDMQGQSPASD